ncbi:hypothetical protein Agub_g14114 [Astrephomene gubernaculifera]|uniref:Guanylate kinase 1 n=1 Tax=Astrephomene gubernaculifera TaxID=47775 RepID=A0AAD3E381_9CHLO|nr:hypothetical protein Agub_g14114 [Astrephomene gubernaculifera]
MERVTIVFVLGAPGSGKGTQCSRIVEKYGWTHLSTGDLLRAEVQAGTEVGQQVDEIMRAGEMVPTDIILDLLSNAMASSGASRFLVDGFPRTLDQLMDFQDQVKPCDGVLVLGLAEEEAVTRLLARGATSGRPDDTEDTIRQRMRVFAQESQPVIDFLADSGGNVHEVDATASVEEVFAAVEPFMNTMDALAVEREAAADGAGRVVRASTGADGVPSVIVGVEEGPADLSDAVVVFVLGAPGAGKGTQCDLIRQRYGWTHVSTGALLRAEVEKGSDVGSQVSALLAGGELVPTEVVLGLLNAAMVATPAARRRFLVDGFPRQLDQLQAFEAAIKPCDGVLLLGLAEEVAVTRLLARGATSGRPDDTEDTIRQRMRVFAQESQPVIDYLRDQGANVAEVDASGEVADVFSRVCRFMDMFGPPLEADLAQLPLEEEPERRGEEEEEEGEGEQQQQGAGDGPAEEGAEPPPGLEGGAGTAGAVAEGMEEVGYNDEQVQAALRIQAARRGYLDRKRVAKLKEEKAATAAQQQDQQQEDQQQEDQPPQQEQQQEEGAGGEDAVAAAAAEAYSEEQIQAALRIQAARRGYLDRKKVDAIRAEKQRLQQEQQQQQQQQEEEQQEQGEQAAEAEAAAEMAADADAAPAEGANLEDYTEEQVQALVRIQAAGRGYLDRKKVAAKRQEQAATAAAAAAPEAEEQPAAQADGEGDGGAEAAAEEAEGGSADAAARSDLPPELADLTEEQLQAAIRIQAAGRGYLDRKKVAKLKEEKAAAAAAAAPETEAAVAQDEGAAAADGAEGGEADAEGEDEEGAAAGGLTLDEAALRIQAAGRGYLDRKRVAKLKEEKAAAEVEKRATEQVDAIRAMLVICGPSGVGKGTLIGRLMADHADKFGFSVSHTTRGPRPGEEDGVHYHFSTREAMQRDIAAGLFLEHAEVHGNMYGTSLAGVAAVGRSGRIAVLDIDVQGASKVKASRAASKARYVFVDPPSLSELEARLRGRGTESEDKVRLRLANATAELDRSRESGFFDARVVNDELEAAYHRLKLTIQELLPGTFSPEELLPPPPSQAEIEAKAAEQVDAIRAMLVICGPSGVGKGTLIGRLMADHADKFGFSVSHTTRGPRPGEEDGVHYHFSTREAMQRDIAAGLFLEHAEVHGNMYGTSLAGVAAVGRSGRIAVLDIDVQGASKVKASRAASKARYVFVDPPSLSELEARLRGRGTESEDKVRLRLANATAELDRSRESGFFDARVVNDELEAAYHRLKLTIQELLPGTFSPEELLPPPPSQAEIEAKAAEQVDAIRAMLVICGPSGVGKGTLIGRLMADHADKFGFSVSHTTRGPRPGEEDGVHYHFSTREAMQRDIAAGLFLEHAEVHGNMYGTSLAGVAAVGRSGRIAVLDIDVQGASKVKASRAASKARYVFVDPPSLSELEARLRGRGTESEDKVRLRLANATAELDRSRESGFFDARVVNDELEAAYHRLKLTIQGLLPGTFSPQDLIPPPLPSLREPPVAGAPSVPKVLPQPSPGRSGGGPAVPPTAGTVTAAAGLPVRQYMDATVVPVLREALRALNELRPEDPLLFVSEFLMKARERVSGAAAKAAGAGDGAQGGAGGVQEVANGAANGDAQ